MAAYHIVLDLEMNPISEENSAHIHNLKTETIEIGAIKINADTNQIVGEYTCVVRPELNDRIEPNITQLTGITTSDVRFGPTFPDALSDFLLWIGTEPVTIYSWSPCDYFQFRKECAAKHLRFPKELKQWVDFQAEYPKYLGYSRKKCLSLKDAAKLIGTPISADSAHRALYDAQITAQLVLFALTGAYKHYTSRIHGMKKNADQAMTYSIGDTCGCKLAALLTKLRTQEESEVSADDTQLHGAAGTVVQNHSR